MEIVTRRIETETVLKTATKTFTRTFMKTDARQRPFRRLLLRLYVIGIATMIAVALTMIATRVFRDRSRRPMLPRTAFAVLGVAEYLVPGPGEPRGSPDSRGEIDRYLERLHREAEILVSIYAPDGTLVATNVQPPFVAPTSDELRRMDKGDPALRPATTIVVPILGRNHLLGYGVARPIPPPHRRELAVDVPIALAWIGLAALLVSRTLGRPLEKIAAAARAFGRGQMSVRTGVDRRDEIGDVARAFDEMSERITKLLVAQRELMASVSHELRTPLARIRVAVELAQDGNAEIARRSLIDVAEDLTEIEDLIKDIFSAVRLEMAELGGSLEDAVPLHRSEVAVAALVEKAVTRLRVRFPARPFQLTIDPACAHGRVHVDAILVRRSLENVLENAQKYSPAAAAVRTVLTRTDGAFIIQITDDGFGIGAADLPFVFSPFFRADRSRTRATGGVGLGLALAKRVIAAHGGTIALASQLDVGTTVTFTLPKSAAPGGELLPAGLGSSA
jgi:two-component system, OmpR family, sensor kinase